jgi:hypothetical protein
VATHSPFVPSLICERPFYSMSEDFWSFGGLLLRNRVDNTMSSYDIFVQDGDMIMHFVLGRLITLIFISLS